ncbi:sortase-dependent protein [Streptomyces sp. NBC_01353]|uniref:sortase-dependent protein n=1 Tax=Streptomyces sp. NBC_01353 TaxID=2903835 RepID=UPI002E2F7F13|nr:sortase-dependent protein [Streptomyces sp. NBC_01353]
MPSHRRPSRRSLTLRTAAFTTAVIGGVLLPSTSAFASDGPSAAPSDSTVRPTAAADATPDSRSDKPQATPAPTSPEKERDTGDTEPRPVPDRTSGEVAAPRGGVAAGERPADRSGDNTTAIAGSVAGAAILAGAGSVMLRRRGAAHRND